MVSVEITSADDKDVRVLHRENFESYGEALAAAKKCILGNYERKREDKPNRAQYAKITIDYFCTDTGAQVCNIHNFAGENGGAMAQLIGNPNCAELQALAENIGKDYSKLCKIV